MIGIEIIGDAEVVRKFDQMPARLHEELKKGIGTLALKLARNVQFDKLSGQVLHQRSTRLIRSIVPITEDSGETVSGIVSTPVKYGKAHEYGFSGTVTVREHLRTIKQAFGRSIAPRQIMVSAHEMKMNLPERSFLRSALRDMEASGAIRAEIDASIERAVK